MLSAQMTCDICGAGEWQPKNEESNQQWYHLILTHKIMEKKVEFRAHCCRPCHLILKHEKETKKEKPN